MSLQLHTYNIHSNICVFKHHIPILWTECKCGQSEAKFPSGGGGDIGARNLNCGTTKLKSTAIFTWTKLTWNRGGLGWGHCLTTLARPMGVGMAWNAYWPLNCRFVLIRAKNNYNRRAASPPPSHSEAGFLRVWCETCYINEFVLWFY